MRLELSAAAIVRLGGRVSNCRVLETVDLAGCCYNRKERQKLAELEVDSLAPLEALIMLYELQEKARTG